MFVAKIVPGGQSQRAGLRENDKIVRINNKVRRYFSNCRAVNEVSINFRKYSEKAPSLY